MFSDLWKRITQVFRQVPCDWEFRDGTPTEGPYIHGTSILALSFSPDDSLLALAGGGALPRADSTVRLVDSVTQKNVRTMFGHTHGIHDLSFDPETGMLASASFDYSVLLWDLREEDVIYLLGQDQKTKGYSHFTSSGSVLIVGEYDYYDGPHSLHVYDLPQRRMTFSYQLPAEQGVSALCVSPDSRFVAFTSGDQNAASPARLRVLDLSEYTIVVDHQLDGYSVFDLVFIDDETILAGVDGGDFGEFEAGLVLIETESGAIRWKKELGGIGVVLAAHPSQPYVAVGFSSPELLFYRTSDWTVSGRHPLKSSDEYGTVCSLAFTHAGDRLAYGTSAGNFDIIEFPTD